MAKAQTKGSGGRSQGSGAGKAADRQREKRERDQAGKPGLQVAGDHPASVAPSLGLGDAPARESPTSTEPAVEAVRGRQGDGGRPYCPAHNCLMQAQSTKGDVTHYRCPVPGCQQGEKRVRPQLLMPAAPQACPQKCCAPAEGEQPRFLEVVPRLSSLVQLHMRCPSCGFHINVPKPQFDAAAVERARREAHRQAEDLAAR